MLRHKAGQRLRQLQHISEEKRTEIAQQLQHADQQIALTQHYPKRA